MGRLTTLLSITREGDLPAPPFVVAANHFSHLDPPLVGAAVGLPIRFLAVDELWGEHRLLDLALVTFGSIPLPRAKTPVTAVRAALRLLDRGENIGVFPEATRVRRWGEEAPRRGAGWLAARKRVPLVPVVVTGTDRLFGIENKLRWGRVNVHVGKPLVGDDAAELTESWRSWIDLHL